MLGIPITSKFILRKLLVWFIFTTKLIHIRDQTSYDSVFTLVFCGCVTLCHCVNIAQGVSLPGDSVGVRHKRQKETFHIGNPVIWTHF